MNVVGINRSYMYVSNRYDKVIWFFDDSHSDDYKCIGENHIVIGEYLKNIVLSTNKMIDLFLERPYKTDSEEMNNRPGFLTNIETILLKGLEEKKRTDKDKNLRVHCGDLRSLLIKFNRPFYAFFIETVNCFYWGGYNRPSLQPESWKTHINSLKGILHSKDTYIQFLREFINYTKINKQIQNIKDPFIRRQLDLYLNDFFKRMPFIQYDDVVSIMTRLKEVDAFDYNQYNIDLISPLFHFIALSIGIVMDLYILARMFRRFSDGSELENIIIDAGSAHTSFYYLFLEDCGFTRVLDTDSGDNEADESGCVNISQAFLDEFLQHQLMV